MLKLVDVTGLLEAVDARHDDGLVDIGVDDQSRPILLAVSDNRPPEMTCGSTREFLALCTITQHFDRPHTPTDQAWIETLDGTIKIEDPHLLAIEDPATLRGELAVVPATRHQRPAPRPDRLRTPDDEHQGRGEAIRKAREAGLEQVRLRRLEVNRAARDDTTIQGPDDLA